MRGRYEVGAKVYVERIVPADGKGTPSRHTRIVGEVVWSGERRTRFAPVAAYRVSLPDGSVVALSSKDICGRVTS